MKKKDIKKLRVIDITGEIEIPSGWQLLKEPIKFVGENGQGEVFRAVIGTS